MLAAFLIRSVLVTRIGLAADSHSCRDQREPGSAGARVFQPMRGPGPGIEIPPYAITRGSASASQQQVISLGDTKWTQEILRPVSVVSQSETTTTKQHNYKTTPDGGKGTGAAEQGPGADPSGEEQERRRPAAAAAAAGREEQREQEEGTAQQVVSPSSSSSRRRRRREQQRRSSSSRSAAEDASSSSSLLSQPGPQAAGRPRGNPPPPSDSGTHTDEAASKPLNNGIVLKSDDKKAESPSVKKSSKQTELVQKPIHSRHGQDKKDRSQTGSNQEDDDRHGAPELLEAFNSLGGSAVEKTSQADSFLTGGLRSDAKAELDEKEEISHTGSIQEDDDRHGAPELVEAFNGLGGSAVEKTSLSLIMGIYRTARTWFIIVIIHVCLTRMALSGFPPNRECPCLGPLWNKHHHR